MSENKFNARYAYDGLERIIHEKARLGIMTSLATHADGLLFNDLKTQCGLTDGNLNRHLAVLTDAALVEVWKGGAGRRSQTLYRLTRTGRKRFLNYIEQLERVIADAASAASQPAARGRPGLATT